MKNLKDRRLVYIEPPKYPRDKIAINVPKGKRDIYKQTAQELGLSLSVLIQYGVEEFIANHADEEAIQRIKAKEKLSKDKRRLIEAFDTLPEESRVIIVKLVEDFAAKASASKNI